MTRIQTGLDTSQIRINDRLRSDSQQDPPPRRYPPYDHSNIFAFFYSSGIKTAVICGRMGHVCSGQLSVLLCQEWNCFCPTRRMFSVVCPLLRLLNAIGYRAIWGPKPSELPRHCSNLAGKHLVLPANTEDELNSSSEHRRTQEGCHGVKDLCCPCPPRGSENPRKFK